MMTEQTLPLPVVAEGSWDYYPQIQELCTLRFGEGYMDETDFRQWMERPDFIQVIFMEGDFAGVAVMRPASAAEVAERMGMTEEEVLKITGGGPAVIYKCAVLRPEYEKRGINRVVAADGLRRAEAAGYSAIFSAAWVCGDVIPAQRTFERLGFTRLYRRKMLWYHNEKYRCVFCGGRCVCDAVIYCKKLGCSGLQQGTN